MVNELPNSQGMIEARARLGFHPASRLRGWRPFARLRCAGRIRVLAQRLRADHPDGAILCLSYSSTILAVLGRLGRAHSLLVEETVLSRSMKGLPGVEIIPCMELLGRLKAGVPPGTFLVLFTDHHLFGPEVCMKRDFLGQECMIPLVEPIFHFRSQLPLVVLAVQSENALSWEACPVPIQETFDRPFAEAVVEWVLGAQERHIRTWPEDIYSWSEIEGRTLGHFKSRALLALRLGASLLQMGRLRGELLDAQVNHWAARLQEEQTRICAREDS